MQITTSFAVLAGAFAAGAAAHPSPVAAHAKAHAQFHERAAPESIAERDVIVEVQEYYIAGKPEAVSTATTTMTATPSTTLASSTSTTSSSSSSAAPTTTSSSSSSVATSSATKVSSSSSAASATKTSTSASSTATSTGTALEFCSSSSKKRATAADISYTGNTGTSDDWGCNIMEVDCSTTSLYDYTMSVSTTGSDYTCAHWNKIGPDGGVDGFWYSALTFSISGDETKCFAFEADTQGGMSCSEGSSVSKTSYGQYAGTWAEYDFGSGTNSGNSGSDVSVLVAQAYDLEFIGMSIKNPSGTLCSSITADGTAYQAYTSGMEDEDGVGCTGYYDGQLTVSLGYSG